MIGILLALQVNIWNEQRKEKIAGNELASRLYQELLTTHMYSKDVFKKIDTQIGYIDLILAQGQKLNVDSLLSASEETLMVQVFTFTTYILTFIEYYAPNMEVFESSLSDGSIKLVMDEELVNALKYVHNDIKTRIKILYEREMASNENIEEYIAENYAGIFEDHSNIKKGKWDNETTKLLLEALQNDGALRFRLQQKNAKLKMKRAHLHHRIIPKIEEIIKNPPKL
jgi:hypothetical protein